MGTWMSRCLRPFSSCHAIVFSNGCVIQSGSSRVVIDYVPGSEPEEWRILWILGWSQSGGGQGTKCESSKHQGDPIHRKVGWSNEKFSEEADKMMGSIDVEQVGSSLPMGALSPGGTSSTYIPSVRFRTPHIRNLIRGDLRFYLIGTLKYSATQNPDFHSCGEL